MNEIKEKIKKIMQRILQNSDVDIAYNTNLFKLGLNSLGKIRALVEIEKMCHIEISDNDIYDDNNFTSIDNIASFVEKYLR